MTAGCLILTLAYLDEDHRYVAQGGEWPGVNGFIMPLFSFPGELAPGLPIRIEGDAAEVQMWVESVGPAGQVTGERRRIDIVDGLGTLPDDGSYQLGILGMWPRGTAEFFVHIQIGPAAVDEPSPLPEAEQGVIPDVVGIDAGDALKVLSQAGFTEVLTTYQPDPELAAGTVLSVEPAPGTEVDTSATIRLVVAGSDVAFDGYLSSLACGQDDMIAFEVRWVDVIAPTSEELIRIHTRGVMDGDELARVAVEAGGAIRIFELIRSGAVIAVIATEDRSVDIGGDRHDSIAGVTCRGSGIEVVGGAG